MGQVEMQRGYGDVIVSRGLQIGSVIRCMDSAAKPKPVIRKAARVSALYYAGATIVMEALTDRFDTPHSIWFYGGEIDVEQSARHHRQVQQRAQNFLPPSLCAGEGHGVSHRSEEHTSELQSLMRISYAVFCLQKKKK